MFALKKHASPVMMKEAELPDMLLGCAIAVRAGKGCGSCSVLHP